MTTLTWRIRLAVIHKARQIIIRLRDEKKITAYQQEVLRHAVHLEESEEMSKQLKQEVDKKIKKQDADLQKLFRKYKKKGQKNEISNPAPNRMHK